MQPSCLDKKKFDFDSRLRDRAVKRLVVTAEEESVHLLHVGNVRGGACTAVVNPRSSQTFSIVIETPDRGLSVSLDVGKFTDNTESDGSNGTEGSGGDTGADSVVGVATDEVRTRGVRANNTTEITATFRVITVSDRQFPAVAIAVGVDPESILGVRAKTVLAVAGVSLTDVSEGRVVRSVDDLDNTVTRSAATGVVAGIVAWVGRGNGGSTSLQCAGTTMGSVRGETTGHALGVGHALGGRRGGHGDDTRSKEGDESEADEGQHFRVC